MPVCFVLMAFVLNQAKGPYWLSCNLDPDYVYLLNAANLAGLKGVGHIDHPGTPVQVMGAITIRVVHALSPSSAGADWHRDVLKRPEYYLRAINFVLVVLNSLMLLGLGLAAAVWFGHISAGLWLQAAPFLNIVLLRFGLTRVTPEPFLLFASHALVIIMAYLFYSSKESKPRSSKLFPIVVAVMALVTGFGIACKITFLPLVLIPLMVLPSLRYRIYYLAGSFAGFVLFTLPIIRMYPRFFQWITLLFSHTGRYGSGSSGFISPRRYFQNILELMAHNPFFTGVFVISIMVVVIILLSRTLRQMWVKRMVFKLTAAAVAAQAAGLLMVGKHPSDHYLLPVMVLSGVLVLLIFFLFQDLELFHNLFQNPINKSFWRSRNLFTKRFLVLSAVVLSAVWVNPVGNIITTVGGMEKAKERSLDLSREVAERFRGYGVVYYYAASSQEYALKFGNDLSRSYHSQELEAIYSSSDVYFYDIWTCKFMRFDYNRSVFFEDIRRKYGDRIVFQGTKGLKIENLELEKVYDNGFQEAVYGIRK